MCLQDVCDISHNLICVMEEEAALADACSCVLICNHIRFEESPQFLGLWGQVSSLLRPWE